MPDEVERQNIITAKELKIILEALNEFPDWPQVSRQKMNLATSAYHKIERVLKEMK